MKAHSTPQLCPLLCVVMPVYNEAVSIGFVMEEWIPVLRRTVGEGLFKILVLNDGSKDDTPKRLDELASRFAELQIHHKPNSGHGQTCILGYRMTAEFGIPWVLQIDSDGQCDPGFFEEFWKEREKFPVQFGLRKKRDDGMIRQWISGILTMNCFLISGSWVRDANVPYRLIRTDLLTRILPAIPAGVYLANILVSILLKKSFSIRWVPIRFRKRHGGEPSVKLLSFVRHAVRLNQEMRSCFKEYVPTHVK